MFTTDNQTTIEELRATITCLQRQNRQLKRLMTIDPLTLVPNRSTFNHRLQEEWQLARQTGMPISLILLSVDHLQEIGQRYGLRYSDSMLQRLAFVLCRVPRRSTDLFARYSEHEFAIILPNTSGEGAQCLAERLLRQTRFCDVTVSIGIASINTSSEDLRQLIGAAGHALYQAKKQGGDCLRLNSSTVNALPNRVGVSA